MLARNAILGMKTVPLSGSTFPPLIPSNISILFLKSKNGTLRNKGMYVVNVTQRLLYLWSTTPARILDNFIFHF